MRALRAVGRFLRDLALGPRPLGSSALQAEAERQRQLSAMRPGP